MSVRVVVADDHPMYRYGLTAILEQREEVEVVASVGDGEALMAAVAEHAPDVVVTDLSMPDLDGVTACRRLAGAAAGGCDSGADHARGRRARVRRAPGRRARLPRQGRGRRGDRARRAGGGRRRRGVRRLRGPADRRLLRRRRAADSAESAPSRTSRPASGRCWTCWPTAAATTRSPGGSAMSEKTVRNHVSQVLTKLQVPDRTAAALRARDAGLGG